MHFRHRQTQQIWPYFLLASLALLVCLAGGIMANVAFAQPSVYQAQQADGPNSPAATSTATPTACAPAWNIVPSVDPSTTYNYLAGMAAVSANDVWAVGAYVYDVAGDYNTLAEHWNGTAWSVVSTPNPASYNELQGVAAIAANDVWAVGLSTNNTNHSTLIEHWNGSSWSIVASPNTGTDDGLVSVAGTSASDVWAVGQYLTNTAINQTLIEHWNGTAWSIVASPDQGTSDNYLYSVAATSAGDAWAVGKYVVSGTDNSLIEHWNGTSWTIVSNPNPEASGLSGVVALSSSDAWAVGNQMNDTIAETLVEHWDGSAWSVVPSPNDGPNNMLYAVDAISANDIWTVGLGSEGSISEHWDGSAWTIVPTPLPGSYIILNAVTAASANDVWAAGDYEDINNNEHTLVEHYVSCNPTPSPTASSTAAPASPTRTATRTVTRTPTQSASSTPTSTPLTPLVSPTTTATSIATATATATVTVPAQSSATPEFRTATSTLTPTPTPPGVTSTPTVASTPTACTISFTDVPPGSTFYPYIHCMACLGIINGYHDGTFKPNNQVTRGQLSKIVSNSAGFNDPQPSQMFQDVPVGSTFQVFIGRLASRGYINGYPCGGPGEPCQPDNLPYFRPNNNATRGQISKIDANAAGFSDPPLGQRFEDVPVGSAFYTYTYRLVSRGVMSGYQCGGIGEPCVPPHQSALLPPQQ